MKKLPMVFVLAVSSLAMSAPALAHHGDAAYDMTHLVKLENVTVVNWLWANPHSILMFDVKDSNGKVTQWVGEAGNPAALSPWGWSKDMIKPGDVITITIFKAKSGAPVSIIHQIVRGDGKEFLDRLGATPAERAAVVAHDYPSENDQSKKSGAAPSSEATARGRTATDSSFNPRDLSGVWGQDAGRITHGLERSPFTAVGQKQFDANKPFQNVKGSRGYVPLAESNDPMVICDPLGFPRNLSTQDRHFEFLQTPNETVELFQYQRIWRKIWTDGRALPANAGKPGGPDLRYYGYSVGRWEGNTFVVDTTGLTPQTWLDAYGNPHSSDLVVEERYTRLDRGHLKLTVTLTDPKTYTKPFVFMSGFVFRLATRASVAGQIAWPARPLTLPEQMCVPSEALTYLKDVAEADVHDKVMSPFLHMPGPSADPH
jgi:Family of unknown function (DUF6152)